MTKLSTCHDAFDASQMRRADHRVNRPGFTGEFFVQNLCDFIKGVHTCIEGFLHFLRRPMTDGAM